MASKRTGSSCGPWYADPEHGAVNAKLYKGLFTSVAIVTSQKLFSSLRCLKEATMLVWKSFQRRQNCWSSAMVTLVGGYSAIGATCVQSSLFGHETEGLSFVYCVRHPYRS